MAQQVPKPFQHYPGCSSGRLQGRSAGRLALSLSTHPNNRTHTHMQWFSLAILLCFVTNLSNNLQDTTVLPYVRLTCIHTCFLLTNAPAHEKACISDKEAHLKRQKHTYTHLGAEPSLCSAGERVGPQQGPPVLSWSPPVWPQATLCSKAAHHSLHTANRLSTCRES